MSQRLATVILFKPSGKYYTEEDWRIPTEADLPDDALRGDLVGPFCMMHSPDFRRIGTGAVLVGTQEPWGYPHLFPNGEGKPRYK